MSLEKQILDLLSGGVPGKLWSEREITEGLGGGFPVSICALERLQEAGKIKLTLNGNRTYVCQLVAS